MHPAQGIGFAITEVYYLQRLHATSKVGVPFKCAAFSDPSALAAYHLVFNRSSTR